MARKLLVQCALLLVVALTSIGVSAQDVVDQTFFMTFVPNIQFAPIYVALEKGYFAEQGINLTIEHGDEPVGLDLIAANQRQFGLISGEEVIKARANGRPVVSVYEWFQQYPVGIVAAAGTGIESVVDLQGRKVGIPGRFGASYNGLIALLSAAGLSEGDIQLDAIGFNAPDVFCLGAVEAAVVYINNEPLQIQNRIDEGECGSYNGIEVFPVAAAADIVSNGLVTNEETIANNPDLVRAMVSAFDAGLRDAIDNPAEAYLLSAKYVDNLIPSDLFQDVLEIAAGDQSEFLGSAPNRDAITASRAELLDTLNGQFEAGDLLQFRVLLNTIDLWDADQLGYSEITSWEVTQETLLTMGFIEESIDLSTAYTNDFVPVIEE